MGRALVCVVIASASVVVACGGPPAASPAQSSGADAPLACAAPTDAARAAVPEADRGFAPIDFDAVPSTVGKVVYAAKGGKVRWRGGSAAGEADAVYAGEALTLCRAEEHKDSPPREPGPGEVVRTRNFGGPSTPAPKYSHVVVKNGDGQLGEILIAELSARPLKYDLRHPGDAHTLLMNAFHEATVLAPKLDALHAKYNYTLSSTGANEPDAARRRDADVAHAMYEGFDADGKLVHNLVYGSNIAKESLLREKGWTVRFGDPALVEVYSHGIKDPEERKKHEPLQACLGRLQSALSAANAIASAEKQKLDKPWRKNMTGVPDAQLAALDADNLGKLDAEIAKRKQQRAEDLASPTCKDP